MERTPVSDALAEVVKALGNGRRVELVELLAQGEHAVEALARLAGMATTTTSAHLQTLKRAGLVHTRREGTTIHYRLAGDDVVQLYLAAKRVGMLRSPALRETAARYLGRGDGHSVPQIAPAAVTSRMTVIDVRPRDEFDAGHLPRAMSLPLDELDGRIAEIPEGATVVVYCRGELCRLARDAARRLRELGIDARAMDEGIIEWRATGAVELDAA